MSISREHFGVHGGRDVSLFTLTNGSITARITDFGGIIVGLHVPDASGIDGDVVLGFDDLDSYLPGHVYFGAIVGRCANRIAGGRFEIDGQTYQLAQNEGNGNHLHGGAVGFNRRLWQSAVEETGDGDRLVLTMTSEHLDEGYPGELSVRAVYGLGGKNELSLDLSAETDRPTIVNLVNHAYFNLAGHAAGTIENHELTVHADEYTPAGPKLIPSGEIRPVDGGPYDLRQPKTIGSALAGTPDKTLDLNFVLKKEAGRLAPAAELKDPASGRTMTVFTTAPGIQVYSGHFIPENTPGKGGRRYGPYGGLCLETQAFPNAINTPTFPSVVLRPGEVYRHKVVYAFGCEAG